MVATRHVTHAYLCAYTPMLRPVLQWEGYLFTSYSRIYAPYSLESLKITMFAVTDPEAVPSTSFTVPETHQAVPLTSLFARPSVIKGGCLTFDLYTLKCNCWLLRFVVFWFSYIS